MGEWTRAELLMLVACILNGGLYPLMWWLAKWIWRTEQRMRRAEYALGINEPVT